MGKSLNDIKRDISLLTLDIKCLDLSSKHAAIAHLEEAIDLLKIGTEHDLANNGTVPGQEKEYHKNKSSNDQRHNEEMDKVLHQIPKQEQFHE